MLRLRRIVPIPDPDSLDIVGPYGTVKVALRRLAAARRMTLRVSGATGAATLTIPARASLPAAQAFLETQAGWIAGRIAGLPDRIAFEPGAVLPLRGEPHRILHWSRVRGAVRATRDEAGAAMIAVSGDTASVPGRVRRFLQAEAGRDLKAAVARHAGALAAKPGRVAVRDTVSRWGSCSSTGQLSFSWRLILAPPFVLDYLAAHEVAHLRELNHSHRFWKLVHDLCPRTEEAERWLKRNGSGLHRYG